MKLLLSNKEKEFSIRAISMTIAVDYKTVYLRVKELVKDNVVLARKAGQTTLCSVNLKEFNADVFRAEFLRKEEALRDENLAAFQSYFEDIKEPFFILLLFGSYASGEKREDSDIDLMLITDSERVKREVKDALSLVPLDVHLLDFSPEEFLSMLKTTGLTVAREAVHNNVILFGVEDYYRLIHYA